VKLLTSTNVLGPSIQRQVLEAFILKKMKESRAMVFALFMMILQAI